MPSCLRVIYSNNVTPVSDLMLSITILTHWRFTYYAVMSKHNEKLLTQFQSNFNAV